jgi:rubrerythrin
MSVINMFKGRDKLITSIRNRLNSTPLKNIDQVLSVGAKKFKSTMIYENVFRPVSIAFASAEQMMLDINADLKKANSILDISVNKRWVQKAKIMIYQIQREFESNLNVDPQVEIDFANGRITQEEYNTIKEKYRNPEVNPAIKWIKATINDPNNLLSDRETEALEKIMKEFSVNGEIDSKKMFDSFTDKEKKHLKIVDNVYKKIQPMVIADAKMQGKAFVLRKNYVHLPKVAKNDISMSNNLDELANSFKNPALKNKAATQRTGKVHAISFDPVFNANAISKKVVISYYMYPTIKTAKITLNGLKRKANTKFEKELTLALEDIFDGIVRSKYSHLSRNRSFITKALAFLGKSGYLAQLAGPVKAAVELTTNITHAVFTDPVSFMSGMKELQSVPREIIDAALKVIPTTQKTRISGEPGLSSKDVDNNLINSSENIFKQEEMTSEFMDKAKTLLGFAKVPTSAIIKFNEGLISKPDTMVARPLFVGAFNKSFESMAGEKPNWNKIANDQSYRDKFAEAIDQAAADGDTAVIDNAASNNPFDSIPRNVLDKDADAIKQVVQMINGYMTRFRTFEYFSAVKAVQGLMGKGNITQAQGAMLLTGTVVRLSMYKMGIDMVFALIFSMLGIDEEDDDLDLDKDITRNVLGAVVTLALGRSMGNISQMPVNFGTEWLNKEYGEGITREGEYNAYKDGVVFSKIPMELKPQDNMIEKILVSSLGSYTPVVKTIIRGGKLATRSVTSTQESTREKNLGELSERIPFEIAGNLGVVPGYKTLRKIYLKHLFNGVKNSKKEESSSGSSKSSYRSRSRSSSSSRSRSRSSSRSRSRSGK